MENRYGYDYPDLTSDDSRDINRLLAERDGGRAVKSRPHVVSERAKPRPALGTNLHGYDYPALSSGDAADVAWRLDSDDRAARRAALDAATKPTAREVEKALSGEGTPSALEARQKEAEAARKADREPELAHWCFLDPQGALQGPYHRLQMRFWFEKGYFEMKTPVRFGLEGPFRMLGDVFGADVAGEYVLAFLDEAAIAKKRAQLGELANRPTTNPHGTWKQKHLKVPATTNNPFPNEDFESPGQELYWCCYQGKVEAAMKLIEAGADVHYMNHNQQDVLSAAAKSGSSELVRALVKCGCNVNHENMWHMTALHEAARHDRPDAIRALVDSGADMEIRDLDGYKPIHTACTTNAVGAIKELVLQGSTVAIRDNHNWTPIMHVLNHGQSAKKKAQIIQLIRKEME